MIRGRQCKSIHAARGVLLAAIAGLLFFSTVIAAPVTVNFSKNDASGTGSLSGAGPNVSGYFVYDSDGANATGGNPANGFYIFSGAPFEFSVQIDNFGTLAGTTIIVDVGDDGAITPTQDVFRVTGSDTPYQVSIVWFGPESTFTGNDIQGISVLDGMSAQLNIRNTSTGEFEMVDALTSLSISNVPLPPAVWLFGSGLLGLVGTARRKNTG